MLHSKALYTQFSHIATRQQKKKRRRSSQQNRKRSSEKSECAFEFTQQQQQKMIIQWHEVEWRQNSQATRVVSDGEKEEWEWVREAEQKRKKKLSNKIDKHFIINQNRIYHVVMWLCMCVCMLYALCACDWWRCRMCNNSVLANNLLNRRAISSKEAQHTHTLPYNIIIHSHASIFFISRPNFIRYDDVSMGFFCRSMLFAKGQQQPCTVAQRKAVCQEDLQYILYTFCWWHYNRKPTTKCVYNALHLGCCRWYSHFAIASKPTKYSWLI